MTMNTQLAASLAASCITSTTASRTRMLAVLAATLLLNAAPASQAHAEDAMDACIKAFVAANLPREQPVTVRKKESESSPIALGRAYRISLTATGATSGKRLARSSCLVDRNGAVIALNGKPVADYLADASLKATEATAAR
jgi:hypothetical protein